VAIASEDYSGTVGLTNDENYFAVAVARRADSFLTLMNLKRLCFNNYYLTLDNYLILDISILDNCTATGHILH